ncbi:hypothetical protein SOVF_089330 [Spinacia oleracea]|nr:hypothetical protein SOVF_089330 [Spinacia oleracea]
MSRDGGGESDDDFMEVDSSTTVDEQSYEHVILKEIPTNAKKKRQGKKPRVESEGGKRRKTSYVWDHFTPVVGDKDHAQCHYCSVKISCVARNGTNGIKSHTKRCKKAPFNLDRKQTILDFEPRTRVNTDGTVETVSIPKLWRFNEAEIRKALAKMLILDELPFAFVELEGFRQCCKIAIPDLFLSRVLLLQGIATASLLNKGRK